MPYAWEPEANGAATTTGSRAVVRPRRAAPEVARDEIDHDAIEVAVAVEEFLDAAESGRARTAGGRPYRQSDLGDVRRSLRNYVVRDLGDMAITEVRRRDVQRLVDRLAAEELSERRIRSIVDALRAMFVYAGRRGWVETNPVRGLTMPREDRYEDDDEDPWLPNDRARRSMTPDLQPLALLPERILSLVLRIVVVVFVVIALISITQSP
jgi:hypothetical protein